ncbi:unnamed protein product [Brassica rapa]|uniref:F-box domain-containing protein n=1 Tax=Brassica campestris TaxID=3711 RepID=A0A3P5ZCW9_BRACM|nr:unnamed protein product [Brassica rapa]VDC70720.1 unnamed protein product [Brassica rapa]
MFSKIKAEDENSSEAPSLIHLTSFIIDILARLSRFNYPKLFLVSKYFQLLVASPELYARRSLLACTEDYLFVALYDINSCYFHHWYILSRKANGSHCLVCAPSTFPFMYYPESPVAVGSRIYVFFWD